MRWFVPGRLEVLGKHTDDAGGRSLLAAVDRGITITLEDADEGIYASTTAVEGELHLAPGTPSGLPKGHWGNYVQATIEAFAEKWLSAYVGEFPDVAETASTIVTRPGGPARRL